MKKLMQNVSVSKKTRTIGKYLHASKDKDCDPWILNSLKLPFTSKGKKF